MQTKSVDLAAYLSLAGIEPADITLDAQKFLIYHYADSEYITSCVQAYQGDGQVPVRTFCEARSRLKQLAGRTMSYFPPSRRQKRF